MFKLSARTDRAVCMAVRMYSAAKDYKLGVFGRIRAIGVVKISLKTACPDESGIYRSPLVANERQLNGLERDGLKICNAKTIVWICFIGFFLLHEIIPAAI